MNVYIELDINNETRKTPLLLNNRGLMAAEDLFPGFNLAQITTNLGLANRSNSGKKEDEIESLKEIPRVGDMVKTIYAAHIGYCRTNKQQELSYEDFLDGMSSVGHQEVFVIFAKLIQASENDKKKPLNSNSKKRHKKRRGNTNHQK